MKINPPASSKRPTSRKKPRIMHHLISVAPETPSAISGGFREIQPHQHLIGLFQRPSRALGKLEAVDGAASALYKSAKWRRAQSRRRCSLSDAVMRAYALRERHTRRMP